MRSAALIMRAYRQAKRRVLRARDFQKISFLFVNKQKKTKERKTRSLKEKWSSNSRANRFLVAWLMPGKGYFF